MLPVTNSADDWTNRTLTKRAQPSRVYGQCDSANSSDVDRTQDTSRVVQAQLTYVCVYVCVYVARCGGGGGVGDSMYAVEYWLTYSFESRRCSGALVARAVQHCVFVVNAVCSSARFFECYQVCSAARCLLLAAGG